MSWNTTVTEGPPNLSFSETMISMKKSSWTLSSQQTYICRRVKDLTWTTGKSIPASYSEAYFQLCYSEEFQRRKENITSRLTKFQSKSDMITLVIVYWSDNSIRLDRIQERTATMIWAKHSCTVERNQLWLMMVILDAIKVTPDMLRLNIR